MTKTMPLVTSAGRARASAAETQGSPALRARRHISSTPPVLGSGLGRPVSAEARSAHQKTKAAHQALPGPSPTEARNSSTASPPLEPGGSSATPTCPAATRSAASANALP
jgi:hypothetical protein